MAQAITYTPIYNPMTPIGMAFGKARAFPHEERGLMGDMYRVIGFYSWQVKCHAL